MTNSLDHTSDVMEGCTRSDDIARIGPYKDFELHSSDVSASDRSMTRYLSLTASMDGID